VQGGKRKRRTYCFQRPGALHFGLHKKAPCLSPNTGRTALAVVAVLLASPSLIAYAVPTAIMSQVDELASSLEPEAITGESHSANTNVVTDESGAPFGNEAENPNKDTGAGPDANEAEKTSSDDFPVDDELDEDNEDDDDDSDMDVNDSGHHHDNFEGDSVNAGVIQHALYTPKGQSSLATSSGSGSRPKQPKSTSTDTKGSKK